jgi:single-strand DNA-binding protein
MGSMASLNKVLLIGNLTKDPELRYTPAGMAVATLHIAVNRKYKARTGELKEDTCFVTVTAWDKQAEVCSQYLQKGRPILVEGSLQSRSWDAPDGQKRTVIEVRAERIQFLGGAQGAHSGKTGTGSKEDQAAEGGAASDAGRSEEMSWEE